jgi:hypothetical protein
LGKALGVSNPDLPLLPQITDRPLFYPNGLNGTRRFVSGACPPSGGGRQKKRKNE